MTFSRPLWLLVGVLAWIVMLWLWRRFDRGQRAALALFIAPRLVARLTGSASRLARLLRRSLTVAAAVCLCLALAGPLWGYRWEQASRRGNEVVFALDTSRSMLAPDVKPSRLLRAKLAIDDMARQLDGDAIGIVAFAGTAFLVCPLTLDYAAFHESLEAIDTDTIPRGGTNIASAIEEAQAALQRRPGTDKTLILVSDGEELEGTALAAAKSAAKDGGMRIYTIGVGTAAGELIPLPERRAGFVTDEHGAVVKSRLDEKSLQAIAAAAGGNYAALGGQAQGVQGIIDDLRGAAKHDLAYRRQKIYTQRFQWPLAAALAMLLGSLVVPTRRMGRVVATAALLFLLWPGENQAQQSVPGAAPTAGEPLRQYNAGTSAYKDGKFPQAEQNFQRSIKGLSSEAQRLADQEDAYYNLGNTLYRTGQQSEKAAPQQAIAKWTDAVRAYDTALQLRASDADAKYNRDLVRRKLDALQQQQNSNQGGGGGGGGSGGGGGGGNDKGGGGQSKNGGQPQSGGQPQGGGQPPTAAPAGQGQSSGAEGGDRAPGQMSREEAQELLDSAKADEHHSLGAPLNARDPQAPPEKPFKNW